MNEILQLLLAVSVVVFTSAMCSLFEAVLYAVPLSHVENLAASGRASGKVLKRLRQQVDKPITAILSLNTVSNTAGAALAGAIAAEVLGRAYLAYFSAAFTLVILIFSEVIPKTAGVVFARPLARFIAYPLYWMVLVFSPMVWMLQQITRFFSSRNTIERVSDAELLMMVRLGIRTGDFRAHEASVIQNILDLERRTARDVMTPRPVIYSLSSGATVEEAIRDERLLNHSRIPVYDADPERITGIVHRRDIFRAVTRKMGQTRIGELMGPVHFTVETCPLDQLLLDFLERRQHLVIIPDEYGGLAGLVSLEDVLEEILGKEIVDEFDEVTDLREHATTQMQDRLAEAGEPSPETGAPAEVEPGEATVTGATHAPESTDEVGARRPDDAAPPASATGS